MLLLAWMSNTLLELIPIPPHSTPNQPPNQPVYSQPSHLRKGNYLRIKPQFIWQSKPLSSFILIIVFLLSIPVYTYINHYNGGSKSAHSDLSSKLTSKSSSSANGPLAVLDLAPEIPLGLTPNASPGSSQPVLAC